MLLVLVVALALMLLAALGWAALRSRSGGVLEDPHSPRAPAATPALGVPPARSSPSAAPTSEVEAVRDYLLAMARAQLGVDLERDELAKQRLGEAAASAIEQLRTRKTADVNLPFLYADASGPKHLNLELHREEIDVLLGRRER